MNQRAAILASDIHRAVQDIISRGLHDPRISGMITVTRVTLDDDLTLAVIYVSIFPHDREKLALHGLVAAANFIRREAGETVRSRALPKFMFKLEIGTKAQAGVIDALLKAEEDRQQPAAWGSAPRPAADERQADETPVDSPDNAPHDSPDNSPDSPPTTRGDAASPSRTEDAP